MFEDTYVCTHVFNPLLAQADRLMFAMHLVHGAHPELFQDQVNSVQYIHTYICKRMQKYNQYLGTYAYTVVVLYYRDGNTLWV